MEIEPKRYRLYLAGKEIRPGFDSIKEAWAYADTEGTKMEVGLTKLWGKKLVSTTPHWKLVDRLTGLAVTRETTKVSRKESRH